MRNHVVQILGALCAALILSAPAAAESDSRISDESVERPPEFFPKRPEPPVELGDAFLGSGRLQKGFEIPTGAVWQPSLVVFGTFRSALQSYDSGAQTFSEWANRLDLFANLYLTSTERFLLGIRPLDEDGRYSGYNFHPERNDGWQDEFNADIRTFFFEGDFGELFPNLAPEDRKGLDIGFSIGRQPLVFQEGLLIDDTLDAIGITQNSLRPPGTSNMRVTFLYGWNGIHRNNNVEDNSAELYGLFTEVDFPSTTLALDLAYLEDDDDTGDAFFAALSAVQRIGHYNTAFRVLSSSAARNTAETSTGTLWFAEVSWTPTHTDDLMYVNGFVAAHNFSSLARDPEAGGPLGRTGLLFAAPRIGRYGTALSNRAKDVVGASVGYQYFFGPLYSTRKQLIVELGVRHDTDDTDRDAIAVGARYQQAFGRHIVWQVDGFAADYENADERFGLRTELIYKF